MANVAGPSDLVGRVSVRLRQSGTRSRARATSGSSPASGSAASPAGALAGGRSGGGASPTARYTRSIAHAYEIITPDATITTSGAHDHRPMTLCQLKSRA